MTAITTQLSIAEELVEVLHSIATAEATLAELHMTRLELLTSLNDGKVLPAPSTPAATAKPTPKSKPVASKKVGAEHPKKPDPITPQAQAEYEKQDELYAAGVEKATDGQKRMIFAMLGTEHSFVSDTDKKAVIRGIIAELHNGWQLESTKDLSKVWAGDVITYLQKHTTAQLQQFTDTSVPF